MSIDALSIDDDSEDFRIRAFQAAANAVSVPLERPILPKSHPAPALSGISSLSASRTEPTVPQFKPQLPQPAKQHFMIGVLGIQKEDERQTEKGTSLFETEVNVSRGNIDKLSAEKHEALKRALEETKNRDTWDVLSNVAQYIGSASAIVLGIACISTGVGTAPGALLIASGGLGLLNSVMHDTHGWESVVSWFTESKELQTKIASKIEMGMFLLSFGLGLAGGISAYSAGAFTAVAEGGRKAFITKAGQAISMSGAFMGAGSRVGGSIVERRIAHLQARIREIDSQMTRNHQNPVASDAEKMIDHNQIISDVTIKGIVASQISFE